MQPQDLIFQLCSQDEQIVRSYECTRLKRFLSPATIGHLTITNKRVVFHSTGKSITGKSLLISEMPLEDTAGVMAYNGLSINWLVFILVMAGLFVVSYLLSGFLPRFFFSWGLGIVLMLPFGVWWFWTSNLLNPELRERVSQSLDQTLGEKVQFHRQPDRIKPYLQILFHIGLAMFTWDIVFRTRLLGDLNFLGYLVLLAVYLWIFITYFGRSRSFSLMIASKTMKSSGIYLPGDSISLLPTRDMTALQSMSASPAADAEKVARELGALLLDIRQLGDAGIQKWMV